MSIIARHFPAGLLLAVSLLIGSLSVAHAGKITVEHAKGTTTLPNTPETVLVFDVASLDTLDAIGVDVAGVAGGFFPGHLSKYADDKYEKIGSLFEPDYEAVNAAEPDLIITGGRSTAAYGDLSGIAPTIDLTVDQHDYLASAVAHAETLGKIFGKEDAVKEKIAALETSVEALKTDAKGAGDALIVLTTGGHMSAYGPGSRFGMIHDEFGILPAVDDLDPAVHGQAISFEFISKIDPEWLFVIDRDAAIEQSGQAAAKLLDNELVRQTTAWKKGQVVYLDPVNWYLIGSGLTALQNQVDEVSAALTETR
ncbi:siderophore ABC transporter substrate-binding protein [Methyloligella solikamskensis]|uniref:Siderophore ABC transporter substrate-binding protein n=1 Tax=Methyloligella solikamskensis TaxID=1177756 RepID=A0ABW3JD11_9HYPH